MKRDPAGSGPAGSRVFGPFAGPGRYLVWKVMGRAIHTATLRSRFNAGVNSMMSATFSAALSRAVCPELCWTWVR